MIGKKFNSWLVLNQIEHPDGKKGLYYECLCKCGNIRIKKATELRAGRGKQCTDCQYAKMYDPEKEIGKIYGKWKVLKFVDIHRKLMRFLCKCECGLEKLHCMADLRSRKSTQCIICHNQETAKRNIKHGRHKDLIYFVWRSMVQRCTNPNVRFYDRYGGRGIKVCERWLKFENFLADMGERPEGMTIDRIDNDGNYEPTNCRWISHKENCNNRKRKSTINP